MKLETISNFYWVCGNIAFSLLLFMVLSFFGFDNRVLAGIIIIPLFPLIMISTDLSIALAIIMLFSQFNISSYRLATLAFIPIVLSSILSHKPLSKETLKIKNPLLFPIIVYTLTMLPSFYNTRNLTQPLILSFNFVSIFLITFFVGSLLTEYKHIIKLIFVFLFMSALNGVNVIIVAITTANRVFGFMGVTYVDFVCIAFLLVILLLVYYRKTHMLPLSLLAAFFFISLIFTQTRSTLLALILTLLVGAIFLFANSDRFSINRKGFIKTIVLLTVLISLGLVFLISHIPGAVNRFSELSSGTSIDVVDENSFGQSSLVTRLLIWYTAFNAIKQHPIIGIGAYSFASESGYYNKLPVAMYKLFVKNLSPHITYLAILTETGIVGLIGFLFFLISVINTSLKAFKKSRTNTQMYFSSGLLLLQIYITFSMCITDAWLWGQCGALWGLIMGISLANYKIVSKSNRTSYL